MKKFLLIFFAFCAVTNVFAQDWCDDEVYSKEKDLSDADLSFPANKETGFIEIAIPMNLRIADDLLIENESSYRILKILVWADYNGNNQYVPLVTGYDILAGATKKIMVTSNELRALRGKSLRIKVYGHKSDSNEITFAFKGSLSEKSHDLYIKIEN